MPIGMYIVLNGMFVTIGHVAIVLTQQTKTICHDTSNH